MFSLSNQSRGTTFSVSIFADVGISEYVPFFTEDGYSVSVRKPPNQHSGVGRVTEFRGEWSADPEGFAIFQV